jgi:hypothetical protein
MEIIFIYTIFDDAILIINLFLDLWCRANIIIILALKLKIYNNCSFCDSPSFLSIPKQLPQENSCIEL